MTHTGHSRRVAGWLLGCLTATVAIDAILDSFIILADFRRTGTLNPLEIIWTVLISVAVTIVMICLLSAIPAAVVVWLSKRFHMRSAWFFGGTGAVIGAMSQFLFISLLSRPASSSPPLELLWLLPVFVVAGLAAGLAYWFVAERSRTTAADPRSPG